MPQTRVTTGESNIAVFYRLTLPDGSRLIFAAVPLDEETATQVLGNVTSDYTLFIPIQPPGVPWPFLRAVQPSLSYLMEQTGLERDPAAVYQQLMAELTTIPPADRLAELADAWHFG